ncbi:type II toxin-antitoxin system PemK/MazF family toxin [Chthonobacter rhizosphaerae]|uniref:type II toxin-antitoxin system PemK/MazF family toxin n=1 Tax=Chthonobacter rhizosphaerae TaxID=2735553 RepID=UPI0015EEA63B
MKRGDVVTVALQGDFGKPRPAVVVQSDLFADAPTVTLAPFTSHLRDADLIRHTVAPSDGNGLRAVSQAMIDKLSTLPRDKIGPVIGRLDPPDMEAINRLLAVFLGLADPPSSLYGPA